MTPYFTDAMTLLKAVMEKLILSLKKDYPDLTFVEGSLLCWSPGKKQIYYKTTDDHRNVCGVLHEIGHARLEHSSYSSDIDLLHKEALAWEEALKIAERYSVELDDSQVQSCLDTYRDWLYKRSTCPNCQAKGIQKRLNTYICINCHNSWLVSNSRFCRPYRRSQT